jgi:hypothetical protein
MPQPEMIIALVVRVIRVFHSSIALRFAVDVGSDVEVVADVETVFELLLEETRAGGNVVLDLVVVLGIDIMSRND